jgi:hypothetical protein
MEPFRNLINMASLLLFKNIPVLLDRKEIKELFRSEMSVFIEIVCNVRRC